MFAQLAVTSASWALGQSGFWDSAVGNPKQADAHQASASAPHRQRKAAVLKVRLCNVLFTFPENRIPSIIKILGHALASAPLSVSANVLHRREGLDQ